MFMEYEILYFRQYVADIFCTRRLLGVAIVDICHCERQCEIYCSHNIYVGLNNNICSKSVDDINNIDVFKTFMLFIVELLHSRKIRLEDELMCFGTDLVHIDVLANKEILKFHRKFKFPLILTTDSKSIYDVRSTRDVVSFFKSIGFSNEEIYNGFYYYPKQIVDFNKERKSMIVKGVKRIDGDDFTDTYDNLESDLEEFNEFGDFDEDFDYDLIDDEDINDEYIDNEEEDEL